MKKSTQILLACLVSCTLALSGCGIITFPSEDGDPDPVSSDTETSTRPVTTTSAQPDDAPEIPASDGFADAQKYVNALRDADFEGTPMFIAQLADYSDLAPDAETEATALDQAALRRNRLVEEKYNTHVLIREAPSREQLIENLRASCDSGEYYADLIAAPLSDLGLMQARGLLLNLQSLPFTDYTADYFNRDAMEQAAGGYAMYGAVGSLTENTQHAYVCFFNKAMTDRYGLESPYTAVQRGNWTWDTVLERQKSLPEGIFLLCSYPSAEDLVQTLFWSGGSHYLTAGTMTTPSLSYAGETTNAAISVMQKIFSDAYASVSGSEALSYFTAGRTFLYLAPLSQAEHLSSMPDGWGLVPLPRFSADDPYYTATDQNAFVICVPRSGIDITRTGLFLQGMFAASYQHLSQSVITQYTTDFLQDNTSIQMLRSVVQGGIRYDFTQFYGTAYPSLISATKDQLSAAVFNSRTITSAYGGYADRVRRDMASAFPMFYKSKM